MVKELKALIAQKLDHFAVNKDIWKEAFHRDFDENEVNLLQEFRCSLENEVFAKLHINFEDTSSLDILI